jgi:hypothetical protein
METTAMIDKGNRSPHRKMTPMETRKQQAFQQGIHAYLWVKGQAKLKELREEFGRWGASGEEVSGALRQMAKGVLRRKSTGEGSSHGMLPAKEVGTAEAAKMLGVSKDTVLKLKAEGLLEYRNLAPPSSSRPIYAFRLSSIMALRNQYRRDEPVYPTRREAHRRRVKGQRKYKHLNLED